MFSSSITRDMIKQTFRSECQGSIQFHEFRGKTAKNILNYMKPHILDECPRTVVLVAGGNDLPNRNYLPEKKIKEIADYIVEGGIECKTDMGVENVLISSILPRLRCEFQGNCHQLNAMLKELCDANGLVFVDHDNIVLGPHGHYDGVHLNVVGTRLLHENLLNAINSTFT